MVTEFSALERSVYTNFYLHLHFKHLSSISWLSYSFLVCGIFCESTEFSVNMTVFSTLVQIHFLDFNKVFWLPEFEITYLQWICSVCFLTAVGKLTKKLILFPSAEGKNTIWCPRCHLRNRWRVRLSERQALWSRRKSLVTNLQCLPDRRVAYNKKASSSELHKTNGKDRCHSQGSKLLQEMIRMLIKVYSSATLKIPTITLVPCKIKNCLPQSTKC